MRIPPRTLNVRLWATMIVTSSLVVAQIQTCAGSGMSVSGGRLGDAFSLDIYGVPGGGALLASDVAAGPISTPYGTVCLGGTQSLVVTPVPLDGNGHFGFSGV